MMGARVTGVDQGSLARMLWGLLTNITGSGHYLRLGKPPEVGVSLTRFLAVLGQPLILSA
jgi:hypothetical protein